MLQARFIGRCTNCGYRIRENADYCPHCGLAYKTAISAFTSIRLRSQSFELFDPETGERGGGGCQTIYNASERKVIHRKWCYDPRTKTRMNEEEELLIPESISTDEEFRDYVSKHHPDWVER